MSKRLLSILLSELKTFRLVCLRCGTAVELDIDALDKGPRPWQCAGCGTHVRPVGHGGAVKPDALSDLAEALRRIRQLDGVTCEFVLPAESD